MKTVNLWHKGFVNLSNNNFDYLYNNQQNSSLVYKFEK